ncbi:3-dehydroquinate synthase, partial [termite gut metagenome]
MRLVKGENESTLMNQQNIILCTNIEADFTQTLIQCSPDKLFVLSDEHTARLCMSRLKEWTCLKDRITEIVIGAGDLHKNTETLIHVWQVLSDKKATRHSLLINLGGGMVTDLGGFAA